MSTDEFDGMTGVDSDITNFPSMLKKQANVIDENQKTIKKLHEKIFTLEIEKKSILADRKDSLIRYGITAGLMIVTMLISGLISIAGAPWVGAFFGIIICVASIPANFSIASGGESSPADILKSAARFMSMRKPNDDASIEAESGK